MPDMQATDTVRHAQSARVTESNEVGVETTVNSSTPLKLRGRMYLVGTSAKEEAEYGTRRPGRLTGLPNGPDEDMPGPQHMTAQPLGGENILWILTVYPTLTRVSLEEVTKARPHLRRSMALLVNPQSEHTHAHLIRFVTERLLVWKSVSCTGRGVYASDEHRT
jgi:hypothetical protein